MDLIFHIEDAYGVRFDSDQVNPSNFRTIEDTVSFVLKQKSMPQASPMPVYMCARSSEPKRRFDDEVASG